ncbi:MAG TPA: asparagine synthase (glutamine-hydrolyzing) [Lentisphaeria bacterium]|nr:MAG: asparagine synthase (glutamine-hydrolyzing) [Lentisphaerae bacterium GWF2_49_21]HBC86814.1 asparagine synthase (glutamine-hydrolyzing) [Lentisphaeria bacterium]
MCGITGISNTNPCGLSISIIKMTSSLAHRGPDDFGYACLSPGKTPSAFHGTSIPDISGNVFLGHRRLSIIDLAGSKQPLSNEDGTVWTVFNGEIYNYIELADSLIKKGHSLKNKGDTEVLVHLWEEYGENMLQHLVGMFAFCIYDSSKDVLFLARDRFGQKPLYYFEKNGCLYFASELQAFFGLEAFKSNETNETAIAQYFRYGFIPNPATVYNNVFSLQQGHFLLRKKGTNIIQQYWKPSVTGEVNSVNLEELQALFDESVRIRLRSDVPFGSFLSGGIDSALVTSSMIKYSSESVKTFTISTGKEYFTDESEAAAETARILKTDHHDFRVTPDFISVAEKLAVHYGQPCSDYSSILTYYVSRDTRNFVKVALTGDGGDEIFAGYNGYLKNNFYSTFGLLPFPLRKAIGSLSGLLPAKNCDRVLSDSISSAFPFPLKGENTAPLYHRKWRENVFNGDFMSQVDVSRRMDIEKFTEYYNSASSSNPVEKWMEADQRLYLCDDILVKLDIASMSVSLECRSPFLDHRFAEFANRISINRKKEGGKSKAILREIALRRNLPHAAGLPKKGFSMPFTEWIRRGQLKDWMNSLIFDNKNSWNNYLSEDSVEKLWSNHQSGKMNHQMRLWMIASLVLWMKAYATS